MDELSDFVKTIVIKELCSDYDVDDKFLDLHDRVQDYVSYYADKFGYDINTPGGKLLAIGRTLRGINEECDKSKLTRLKPDTRYKPFK